MKYINKLLSFLFDRVECSNIITVKYAPYPSNSYKENIHVADVTTKRFGKVIKQEKCYNNMYRNAWYAWKGSDNKHVSSRVVSAIKLWYKTEVESKEREEFLNMTNKIKEACDAA